MCMSRTSCRAFGRIVCLLLAKPFFSAKPRADLVRTWHSQRTVITNICSMRLHIFLHHRCFHRSYDVLKSFRMQISLWYAASFASVSQLVWRRNQLWMQCISTKRSLWKSLDNIRIRGCFLTVYRITSPLLAIQLRPNCCTLLYS